MVEDQEQEYGHGYGGLSAEPSTAEALSLLTQTNPAELVAQIEHMLAGEVWNPTDEKYEEKQTSFLNEDGRTAIATIIKSVVNTNTILSNLTEKEISKIIIDIGDEITMLLIMGHEDFDVDKRNLVTIVSLCCRMCYLSLKRCLNQGERIFLKTAIRSHETNIVRHQPQEERRRDSSFFGLFKR